MEKYEGLFAKWLGLMVAQVLMATQRPAVGRCRVRGPVVDRVHWSTVDQGHRGGAVRGGVPWPGFGELAHGATGHGGARRGHERATQATTNSLGPFFVAKYGRRGLSTWQHRTAAAADHGVPKRCTEREREHAEGTSGFFTLVRTP